MAALPCADRCPLVASLIAQHARDPLSVRAARVAAGLTPVYVPITAEPDVGSPAASLSGTGGPA